MRQVIAFPGTQGSFSATAAQEAFPQGECMGYPTFPEAAQAVVDGRADYALLPVENSFAGAVLPTYSLLEKLPLHIVGETMKAVAFGEGFGFATLRGSQANDPFRMDGERVVTASNHSGGVNGGITNGMPVIFRCAMRATPSIAREQQTVSLREGKDTTLSVHGRHDPCILPRAVPVIEAMAAIGVMDLWKERAACVR